MPPRPFSFNAVKSVLNPSPVTLAQVGWASTATPPAALIQAMASAGRGSSRATYAGRPSARYRSKASLAEETYFFSSRVAQYAAGPLNPCRLRPAPLHRITPAQCAQSFDDQWIAAMPTHPQGGQASNAVRALPIHAIAQNMELALANEGADFHAGNHFDSQFCSGCNGVRDTGYNVVIGNGQGRTVALSASRSTSAGERLPSEWVVWRWRSMRLMATRGVRCLPAC